ncbi:MAG: hypothetical protein ABIK09_06875 [Pseudomonadota bacterium]
MKIRPIGQLGTHLRRVAPSVRSSELRQSRRIEGQLDQGGEMRVFPQIHLWIHQAVPLDGDLVRTACKAVVTVQRNEGWFEYWINIRQFDEHGTPSDPPDQIRLAMRSDSTRHRLERTLVKLRGGEIPEPDRCRPMPAKPNRNDLVLVILPGLDAQIYPGLETFTSAANGKRVLWCFADEDGFADEGQYKTAGIGQTKENGMTASQGRMQVVGYSERGLVNALVGYLRKDLSRVRQFLKQIVFFIGGGGTPAMDSLIADLEDYAFIVEPGFSQFGDPDLILVCCRTEDPKPWLVFVEAKVKDYLDSAKRPNGVECMKTTKGKGSTGYNSQIHGQLSLKYRLARALARFNAGDETLIEGKGLYEAYKEHQGDRRAQGARRLAKEPNIKHLVPQLLGPTESGDDALLSRCFFVALTTDEVFPFNHPDTMPEGKYFPSYLEPDTLNPPPLVHNALATSHTGWVGWHGLIGEEGLAGLKDDADFKPAWELVKIDWDLRRCEKAQGGGSSIRTQPIKQLRKKTRDLFTDICARVELEANKNAPKLTMKEAKGSYSLIFRGRTIGKIIPMERQEGGTVFLGVAGVEASNLPEEFEEREEIINGQPFQLAGIQATTLQPAVDTLVQKFIACLSET